MAFRVDYAEPLIGKDGQVHDSRVFETKGELQDFLRSLHPTAALVVYRDGKRLSGTEIADLRKG